MTTNDRLRMLMAFHNISQKQLADDLGISTPTLRARLEDGNWRHYEIMALIKILKIEKPEAVFFEVTDNG